MSDEPETPPPGEPAVRPLSSHTEAEQEILATVARTNGDAWVEGHAHLILEQARAIGDLPEPESERPTLILGRVAEGGRMRLDLVLDFARAFLKRDLTPEEVQETREFWRQRFPGDPTAQEP